MRKTLIFCSLMLVCCGLVFAKGETRGPAPVQADKAAIQVEKDASAPSTIPVERHNSGLDQGGENCTLGFVIPGLPFSDIGTTIGHINDINVICEYGGGAAPDVCYLYTPAVSGGITVDLCNSWYDTKVGVFNSAGVQICCNDDWCDNPNYSADNFYQSYIECCYLEANQTYCIVVDGFGSFAGDYNLVVTPSLIDCTPPPPFECDCGGEWCNHTGGFIADYATLTTTVDVGVEYHITDVNVCLDLDHTWISDIEIRLTSPSGTTVFLWNHQCGGENDMPCVHFDDAASGFLSCPPSEGQTGWPSGFLSDFIGENASGTWTLDIYDWAGGDTGPLNFWCLSFEYDYILPVTFGSFSAIAGDNAVQLNWNTESETSNDRFEIMRDGATVGEVDATNSATGSNYSWVDNDAHNGTTYNYALVSVDMRGNREELATVQATPNFTNATVTEYALMQNYPNPFNPETNITFDLVESGMVTLNVYNMLGQQVATLVNGSMEAGRHVVSFNAANLPSGLYLYRLEAGEFSAQMKMVLMK